MTLRLHAHYPTSINKSGLSRPFVTHNLIRTFERYLDLILEEWSESDKERKILRKNLGYTLQWLEFSSALLLEHYERVRDKKESSLQSTVESMMTLQFCVFTHGVLEGIGSYLFRLNQNKNPRIARHRKWDVNVKCGDWKDEIKKAVYPSKSEARKSLAEDIQKIIDLRDRVHLDTIRPKTHFEDFGLNCFVLCHKTLKLVLEQLSQKKINSSPLFEDVEKSLADLISGAFAFIDMKLT